MGRIFASLIVLTLAIATMARTHTRNHFHTSAPMTFYTVTNSYQTSAGGNIFYLDRNLCSCNKGAIGYFQIQRSGDNLRYYTTCPKGSAITGPEMIKYTNYNATNGDKSVNFLDRHNMSYKYTCVAANVLCCKKATSSPQAMGDKTTFYLDRQQIGDHKGKNKAFSQLRLRTKYGPDQMWYEYKMCELMDMDAHAAMQQAESQLRSSNHGLIAAGKEQAAAKEAQAAVQKQIDDLTANLKAATQALEAKVAAATQASTTAATTLTAAASHPGLKCSS